MINNNWLHINNNLISFPLKPCPWCKKTPQLQMPLDPKMERGYTRGWIEKDETWIWKIYCNCEVNIEAKVSIRKTSKSNQFRLLTKLNALVDKWNAGNPEKAYEKKVIDLRKIPNLEMK